ncbi:unnamed protein product [Dicrocoelium dendriticum]|nr:unnamed protein product [Dicrocoelium dendriticum]
MESFFLSETTKYLYLLFDEENFLNALPGDGHPSHHYLSPSGGVCSPELGGYIFNTEAHPIDPGSIHCCHVANTLEKVTGGHFPPSDSSDQLIPAEDIEALISHEEHMSPLTDLLGLIDSAQAQQLSVDSTIVTSSSFVSHTDHPAPDVTEPWSDLKDMVFSVMTKSHQDTHSNHTAPFTMFDDLDSIQPPLLTCPYPPFHRRYTFSGQMIVPVD